MKLEFDSIEELTEFYKKYIEPKQEAKIKEPREDPKRDLVLQTQNNNKMNVLELDKIINDV